MYVSMYVCKYVCMCLRACVRACMHARASVLQADDSYVRILLGQKNSACQQIFHKTANMYKL